MAEKITLEELSISDVNRIIALKGEVLRNRNFDPNVEHALYDWYITRNPFRQEGMPFGFVLKQGGSIAGSVTLVPASFLLRGKPVYGCFEVDLMVARQARFHGISLLNEVWKKEQFPVVVSTTPNEMSFSLERALGAISVPYTDRLFKKVIAVDRFCTKTYRKGVSAAMAGFFISTHGMFHKIHNIASKHGAAPVFREEKIGAFDSRFDMLNEEIAKDHDLMQSRNSRTLRWRYFDFPFGRRAIYAISDNKETLRGYIVIQHETSANGVSTGNIIDLVARKGDAEALARLLALADRHAKDEGMDVLQMISFNKTIASALTCAGFIARRLPMPACLFKIQDPAPADIFFSSSGGDTAVYSCIERRP